MTKVLAQMYNQGAGTKIPGTETLEVLIMRGSKNPNPGALERVRREKKISRKKLSELSGVSARSIGCYEQGQNDINIANVKTVRALAKALNVPIEKILDDEE